MQAKLILIAALATALIAAVTIGYATLFGASGNFRVYLTSSESTAEKIVQWAVSHKDGVVNIQHLVGTATDKKVTQYISADGKYNVFFTGSGPGEVLHFGCTDKLASGVDIGVGSLSSLPNGDFAFTSGDATLLTIKMAGGKPSSVVMDTVVYTVDKFDYDLEIDVLATNPDIPCDSKFHFPAGSEPEGRRDLAALEGNNAYTKWLNVMFGTSYGSTISGSLGSFVPSGGGRTSKDYTYAFQAGKAEFSSWKNDNDGGWCGITFTGSDDAADFAVDVDAREEPCFAGNTCHKGFMAYFNVLKSSVVTSLNACPHSKVYMMGHSLGGATAMIAAGYAKSGGLGRTFTEVRSVTAGAPRPFRGNYDVGSVYRLVSENDPIPAAPPATLGWHHGKSSVRICDSAINSVSNWSWKTWKFTTTSTEIFECSASSDNWGAWFQPWFAGDHMSTAYLKHFRGASNYGWTIFAI